MAAKNVVVYDKAKWHANHKDYPKDLDERGSFLYGGFFLAWALANGLISREARDDFGEDFLRLERREITPGQAYGILDGVLASDLFTNEGNGFANYCFESDDFDYYGLFEESLAEDLPSPYHVRDDWKSFEILKDRLDGEYAHWQSLHRR